LVFIKFFYSISQFFLPTGFSLIGLVSVFGKHWRAVRDCEAVSLWQVR